MQRTLGQAFFILVFLAWPYALSAADFADFLQANDPRVVASDKAATTFFLKTFGPSLELSKGLPQHRRTPPSLPKELRQRLSPFVTNLATWHLTRDLLTALAQGKPALLQTILEQQQRQIEWLKQAQPDLPDLLASVRTIAQLQTPAPSGNLFLRQSFLPIATAHAKAGLLQLQVRSEQRAWTTWQAIQTWSNDRKNEQGLRRLCGTWQWLIHNHQNHGDHKTVMVYPPPSQYHRMDPQPAAVRVQGDTVYIRWEFPRGIVQEESLLLSEKDQLLSGTFVNNLGPNGNITARRIKPCGEIGG